MQKTYLDDDGNPIAGTGKYLDESGSPVDAPTPAPKPTPEERVAATRKAVMDRVKGFNVGTAKGVASTVYGLGELGKKFPIVPGVTAGDIGNKLSELIHGSRPAPTMREHGLSDLVTGRERDDKDYGREVLGLTPRSTSEAVGFGAEQIAEFLVPGSAAYKLAKAAKVATAGMKGGKAIGFGADMAIQAATAAGVTAAQGGDVEQAATIGAALPIVPPVLKKTAQVARTTLSPFMNSVRLEPMRAIIKAIKPGKHNFKFEKDMALAMTDLKATEKLTGKAIESVDDLVTNARATKTRLWDEYEKMFGGKPPILDATPVSDSILKTISGRTQHLDPKLADSILGKATKYDKLKLDARELENWLQEANAELQGFYAKNPHMRSVSLRAFPDMAATKAEAEALRDVLYNAMPGAKGLKTRYGALINVENEAMGRSIVAKRQWEESLAEQIAAAKGVFSIPGKLMHPLQTMEGAANAAVAKMVKERNTSDYLIKHAFKDWK